jgi:hypothetical protein
MSLFGPVSYKDTPDLPGTAPVKNGFFLFWEYIFQKVLAFLFEEPYLFSYNLPLLVYVYYTIKRILRRQLTGSRHNFMLLRA